MPAVKDVFVETAKRVRNARTDRDVEKALRRASERAARARVEAEMAQDLLDLAVGIAHEERHLTQGRIAGIVGVSQPAIHKMAKKAADAVKHGLAYPSPTAAALAFHNGSISRENLIEVLTSWPYEPGRQPTREDYQARGELVDPGTLGQFGEVHLALRRGLIDQATYLQIASGVAARSGRTQQTATDAERDAALAEVARISEHVLSHATPADTPTRRRSSRTGVKGVVTTTPRSNDLGTPKGRRNSKGGQGKVVRNSPGAQPTTWAAQDTPKSSRGRSGTAAAPAKRRAAQ